jgi:hypothetical protein
MIHACRSENVGLMPNYIVSRQLTRDFQRVDSAPSLPTGQVRLDICPKNT